MPDRRPCGRLDGHPPHSWNGHDRVGIWPDDRLLVVTFTCPGQIEIEGGSR